MALWQYPLYRQQIDKSDDVEVQPLLKPALLSIVFALLLISLGITWNWWKHEQLKGQMQQALSAYNDGDLKQSVVLLKEIIETNPGEGLAYTNLAITYESLGYRDSAIAVTEAWLKIMPEDSEAKERLYQLRYQREGSE
jgi:tetratricopeptide (TPR) repeat protein